MSNRNFDASIITKRTRDRTIAQNLYNNQKSGVQIINNPQTSNPNWSIIP